MTPVLFSRMDADDYWTQARRPLACLAFLVPLLLSYELGVHWAGSAQSNLVRNGADYWMRNWLRDAGLQHAFLLPVLVAATLLGWHIVGRYPWRIHADTLLGMVAESLLFAFCLVAIGQLQSLAFEHWIDPQPLVIGGRATYLRIVSFVGAGVYEEVMFRLCLLPACYLVMRALLLPGKVAACMAVLATSVVFSGAHYIGDAGDQFSSFTFAFRALAGLFFAILFLVRGFGITVGCHAAYDVIVGVVLASQR